MKKIKLFLLLLFCSTIAGAQNIIKMEYFIDVDSGFGSCIDISGFTQSPNVVNHLYSIPASITTGVHTIGVRSKDANDVWSQSNFYPILVQDTTSSLGVIVALEYFWDVDSGFYYYVPYTPSSFVTDLSNEIVNVAVPLNLSVGTHILFVRSRNSYGQWSHTNYTQNVTVDTLTGLTELNEIGINIYPNPFADEINVTPKDNQKMRLVLYNESGQLVLDKVILQSTQINTQSLAPGAYTVFIWAEKQKIYRSTIIKQ